MSLVHFENPDPRRGAPALAVTLVAMREVKARPATWARIATYGSAGSASSFVSRLRSRLEPAPEGRLDFTVRSRGDGSADVFAVFLPEEEA